MNKKEGVKIWLLLYLKQASDIMKKYRPDKLDSDAYCVDMIELTYRFADHILKEIDDQ